MLIANNIQQTELESDKKLINPINPTKPSLNLNPVTTVPTSTNFNCQPPHVAFIGQANGIQRVLNLKPKKANNQPNKTNGINNINSSSFNFVPQPSNSFLTLKITGNGLQSKFQFKLFLKNLVPLLFYFLFLF